MRLLGLYLIEDFLYVLLNLIHQVGVLPKVTHQARVLLRILASTDFSQVLPLSSNIQEQSHLTSATLGIMLLSIFYP